MFVKLSCRYVAVGQRIESGLTHSLIAQVERVRIAASNPRAVSLVELCS
jgi:hypothetical protein